MTRQSIFRTLCAGLLATLCLAAAPARADTDYSDVWYEGPTMGGWGVTFSQNDNLIYTTFFVYDASNKPVWFGGTMSRSTDGVYSGTLYVVLSGDFYGHSPFNPSLSSFQPAGTMSFTATDPSHGVLSYSVNSTYSGVGTTAGRTVSIQRQSLTAYNVSGTYLGAERFTLTGSGCGTATTPQSYFDQLVVVQTPTSAGSLNSTIKISVFDDVGNAVCTIQGAATQTGKVIEMPSASSTCPSDSATVAARVYDMRVSPNTGLEYRWTSTIIPDCTLEGRVNVLRSQ